MLLLLFNAPASIWTPSTKQVEIWTGNSGVPAGPWLPVHTNFLTLVDGLSVLILSASPYALELEDQSRNEPQFTKLA